MRIGFVHNRYQQAGGEDAVFRAEGELLRAAGHQVIEYVRNNDEIALNGFLSRTRVAMGTVWARDSYRTIQGLIGRQKPDVVHFHNTFPLISPSAYYACHKAGVPIVQTLHNYRLLCPAATFYRDDHICEECFEHSLLRSLRYGCYRDSRAATVAVASMLTIHRGLGTWHKKVDVYIALSEFVRRKFIKAGLPEGRIVVKPNFVHPDPALRSGTGEYALFVGRLAPEKGLGTLLAARQRWGGAPPLRVVGDGPLRANLETEASRVGLTGVAFSGRLPRNQALQAIKRARFLIFPSAWYECFPLTLIESFACGVPVIASRLGAMEEIVADGRTGLHFTPGDPDDLATKVQWAWSHPREMEEMGRAARAEYEAKYTAARSYEILMDIYNRVLLGCAPTAG